LIELLKKNAFTWASEAETALQALKKAITHASILTMSDFQKPFMVETEASEQGIGTILMQEGRPIAYYSQALGVRARSLFTYEKELMAVLAAVNK
jgi:RNase H-like domain found in reverse transcriptase